MAETVRRDDVVAFRLLAHGLVVRAGEDGLVDAAGRCGVQNSPPGSALLALHARVRHLTPARLAHAEAEERSLLQTWCMRGSPFYFPTVDAAVFTTGVLPPTETAMRHLVPGVEPALEQLGMGLAEAVGLAGAEVGEVLTGKRLPIDVLGAGLASRIADLLPPRQREVWEAEGPYAPGQPLGEGVVHFCLRILTLTGRVCLAPRADDKAPFVLVSEWLGRPLPDVPPADARAELLRRYLRCYGPSGPAEFAAWLGIRAGDTHPWWSTVEDELTQVDFHGTSWILTEDLGALRSAPRAEGVRLLPAGDPYTQQRDRETIVDKEHQRDVWRTAGSPGTVLVDGEIAGTWRPRKRGRELTLRVQGLRPLTRRDRSRLQDEAEQVAPLRGASAVTVELDTD